ncbi:hypothetical protein [Halorientalis salina]|uniref:hypothetical protein n=1 Tax=Halorientalis salina TaxID=2932266 RepID=UPI0010AB9C54|nr:hypothetical protein [Halorientalis salina]
MNDHRVLGGVLLVLAVLLAANPLYIFQHPDEVNEVKVGNSYDRTPTANYTYEELSPRAQELVRQAIESEDDTTRFRGDRNRPDEFRFEAASNGTREVAGSLYRIASNGTNYTLAYTYRYSNESSRVTVDGPDDRIPRANYSYEELSPRARTVFDEAMSAENNTTQFQGAENRPDEFEVPPQSNTSGGVVVGAVYRVEYNGTNYTIETFMPPRVSNTETQRSQALIGFGVVLGVIGALFVWRAQPQMLGLTFGSLGVAFLVLNLGYRYAPDLFGWLTVFGSSIFVSLALLAGIVSAGYLLYKTNRERQLARSA